MDTRVLELIPTNRISASRVSLPRTPHSADALLKRVLVEGVCRRCGARCCRATGVDISEKDPNFETLARAFRGQLTHLGADSWYLGFHDRDCPGLDLGNCGVYSVRPEVCRIFPFFVSRVSRDKIIAKGICPVLAYLWDRDVQYLYLEEMVARKNSHLVPALPLVGPAIIALLQARASIYDKWQFENSEQGSFISITSPYRR